LADNFDRIPYLQGQSTFILAGLVAVAVAFIPGVELEILGQYLPDLGAGFENILEALLILFTASKSHDKLFDRFN
jgi:hypothetical protein